MVMPPRSSGDLVSAGTRRSLLGFSALGIAAFLYGVFAGEGLRAWQALLVNFCGYQMDYKHRLPHGTLRRMCAHGNVMLTEGMYILVNLCAER